MSLAFKNISYSYGPSERVLKDVSFEARPGQITCLLGPSGCGKTTLLRLAAGLLPIETGVIELNGNQLAAPGISPPPEQRPIGLVFQEGALFPHLNVQQNVEFGLPGDGTRKARSISILNQVGLEGFESRFPHTLSGGQQQRVALARALAPQPEVLLMDEPFANIDSQLRRKLREDTRRMLIETDAVAILVTHDPEEALDMADHIVILDGGVLVQEGSSKHVVDSPRTAGVAKLFGNGQSIDASIEAGGVTTPFGLWPPSCLAGNEFPSGEVELVVRPESLSINPAEGRCRIVDVRHSPAGKKVRVSGSDGWEVVCLAPVSAEYSRGEKVSVSPQERSVFAFPKP